MFKFGFSENLECKEASDKYEDSLDQTWLPSKKLTPHKVNKIADNVNIQSISIGSHQIHYICGKDIITHFKDDTNCEQNSLLNAEQNNSDLLPAIYEGGLKIWECSFDLINYINEQNLDLKSKKVLDLGCGVGLVGTFAALKGTQTVSFQDYNSEVLEAATMPCLSLNGVNLETCEFYSGDWQSFCDLQNNLEENAKYDFIFTSETVYNTNNYKKLINIFSNLLKKDGEIYLAAKYYYFGVGGGIAQFQDQLVKENIFNCNTCWICPEGVKRAILKITLK